MPELKWNEYDFIECLGVLPEIEEYFTCHYFKVIRNELIIEMTIWQIESCIAISLGKENSKEPFVTIYFIVRDKVSFISEKNYAFLIFRDCVVVSSEFWMHQKEEKDFFNKDLFPNTLNFEFHVYPRIELKFS